jgi:hypothetical protein
MAFKELKGKEALEQCICIGVLKPGRLCSVLRIDAPEG